MANKGSDPNERIQSSADVEQSTPTFSTDRELTTPATITTTRDTSIDTSRDTSIDKTSSKSTPLTDREQFTPKTKTTATTRTTAKSTPINNREQFTPKSTATARTTPYSAKDQSPGSRTSNTNSVSSTKRNPKKKKKEKEEIHKKMTDTGGDISTRDESSSYQTNSMNIPDLDSDNKENVLEYKSQENQSNQENRPPVNDNENNVSDQPSKPDVNMEKLIKEMRTLIKEETGAVLEPCPVIIQEEIVPIMDSIPPIICDPIMEWIQPGTHSQRRNSSFSIPASSRRSSRRESIMQSHTSSYLSPSLFPSGPMPHFSTDHIVPDGLSILPSGRSFIIQPDHVELANDQGSRSKSISESNSSKRNSFIRRKSSFSPFVNTITIMPSSPLPKTGISIPIDSQEDPDFLSDLNEPIFQNKRIFIPGFTPQTAGKDNFLTLPGIDVSQKLVEDQVLINHSIAIGPLEKKSTNQKNQNIGKLSKRVIESGIVKKPKGSNEQAKQPKGSIEPTVVKQSKGKKGSFEASSQPSIPNIQKNLDASPTTVPDHHIIPFTDDSHSTHESNSNPNNDSIASYSNDSDTSPNNGSDTNPNNESDTNPNNDSDTSPNNESDTNPNNDSDTSPNNESDTNPNNDSDTGYSDTNPNNESDTNPNNHSDPSPYNYSDTAPHNDSDSNPSHHSYSNSKNQNISMNDNNLDRYMEFIKPKPKKEMKRKRMITNAQKKLNYLESIKSRKGPEVRARLAPCPREIRNLILWKEIPQTLLDIAVEKRLEMDKDKEEEREKKERGVWVGDVGWNSHIRKPTSDPRIQLQRLSEKMKKLIMMMT